MVFTRIHAALLSMPVRPLGYRHGPVSYTHLDVYKRQPLDRTVSLVGYTAAPCMLLALGLDLRQKLALAMHRAEGHAALRQVWLISCKLLLHPLLCWAIMWLLGISGAWLAIGVIMSGTATALIVTVLAEIYGAVPEESALTAVLSNALSMFTLTGFVWLFMRLGMI